MAITAPEARRRKSAGGHGISAKFAALAGGVAKIAGRPYAFIVCLAIVLIWAASGPIAGFSDTWQLVINTSTTIITFLMVFLIQNSQNRDNAAIHAKLDELIRKGNSENRFIGIEHLSDKELEGILEEVEAYAHNLHRKRQHGSKPQPETS